MKVETSEYSPRNFTVTEIPKELHRKLRIHAAETGRTIKSVVIEAVDKYIEYYEKENKKVK